MNCFLLRTLRNDVRDHLNGVRGDCPVFTVRNFIRIISTASKYPTKMPAGEEIILPVSFKTIKYHPEMPCGNGRHLNGRKMEVMCRHREKYGAFQQPARRPVIANAVKQSMRVHWIASLRSQCRSL
jgi:hypothetical protein